MLQKGHTYLDIKFVKTLNDLMEAAIFDFMY